MSDRSKPRKLQTPRRRLPSRPACIRAPRDHLPTLLALAAALLLACSDGGAGPDAGAAPNGPHVELGTGETEFESMPDDGVLPLAAGLQGGFHVWVSFRAFGLTGTRLRLVIEGSRAVPGAAQLVVSGAVRVTPALDDSGAALEDGAGQPAMDFAGWPFQIDDARCAHGQAIDLRITVSDEDGASASASGAGVLSLAERLRSLNCDSP